MSRSQRSKVPISLPSFLLSCLPSVLPSAKIQGTYGRKDGRKEGRTDGRKEGRKNGRKEGRKGHRYLRKEGRTEGRSKVLVCVSLSDFSRLSFPLLPLPSLPQRPSLYLFQALPSLHFTIFLHFTALSFPLPSFLPSFLPPSLPSGQRAHVGTGHRYRYFSMKSFLPYRRFLLNLFAELVLTALTFFK